MIFNDLIQLEEHARSTLLIVVLPRSGAGAKVVEGYVAHLVLPQVVRGRGARYPVLSAVGLPAATALLTVICIWKQFSNMCFDNYPNS